MLYNDMIEPIHPDEDDEFIYNPEFLVNNTSDNGSPLGYNRKSGSKLFGESPADTLKVSSNVDLALILEPVKDLDQNNINSKNINMHKNLHTYLEEEQCNEEFEKVKQEFLDNINESGSDMGSDDEISPPAFSNLTPENISPAMRVSSGGDTGKNGSKKNRFNRLGSGQNLEASPWIYDQITDLHKMRQSPDLDFTGDF